MTISNHGECSSMVRALVCGTKDNGSTPFIHTNIAIIQLVKFTTIYQLNNFNYDFLYYLK